MHHNKPLRHHPQPLVTRIFPHPLRMVLVTLGAVNGRIISCETIFTSHTPIVLPEYECNSSKETQNNTNNNNHHINTCVSNTKMMFFTCKPNLWCISSHRFWESQNTYVNRSCARFLY
eukprot:m.141526 g.141526  ORF g.141526 m.141526 type:complete len:118 (+) comp30192_c0_seq12:1816-2169(+)